MTTLKAFVRAIDIVNVVGLSGLGLVAAGVWGLAGWPWSAILIGSALVGLFAVREVRAIVRG